MSIYVCIQIYDKKYAHSSHLVFCRGLIPGPLLLIWINLNPGMDK